VDELETGACAQLAIMGEIAQLDLRSRAALRRATETGNAFQSATLRCARGFVWLAGDDPATAMLDADTIAHIWIRTGPSTATFFLTASAIWIKVHALLYLGDGAAALRLLREYWPRFVRAGYRDLEPWTTVLRVFQGTAALAAAQAMPGRHALRSVDGCIAALGRMRRPFASASQRLLAAGRAQLNGRSSLALELYTAAADAYEAQGLSAYAWAARMRQAELLSGPDRDAIEQRALAWFRAQSIARPEHWIRMYAPIMGGIS
jgi:hypothetical protein